MMGVMNSSRMGWVSRGGREGGEGGETVYDVTMTTQKPKRNLNQKGTPQIVNPHLNCLDKA